MTDSLKIRGPQDPNTVNIHQDHEIEYWTKKWNVSKLQLIAAVQAVGTSATAVAKRLGK